MSSNDNTHQNSTQWVEQATDFSGFSNEFLLAVARLVRLCADIEVIIDFFLADLSQAPFESYFTLAGQLSVQQKKQRALELAKARGRSEDFNKAFPTHFDRFLKLETQ